MKHNKLKIVRYMNVSVEKGVLKATRTSRFSFFQWILTIIWVMFIVSAALLMSSTKYPTYQGTIMTIVISLVVIGLIGFIVYNGSPSKIPTFIITNKDVQYRTNGTLYSIPFDKVSLMKIGPGDIRKNGIVRIHEFCLHVVMNDMERAKPIQTKFKTPGEKYWLSELRIRNLYFTCDDYKLVLGHLKKYTDKHGIHL